MKNFFAVFILFFLTLTTYAQYTGFTPWEKCFGKNASCDDYGCSSIKISTSSSSDVVVIVKRYGRIKKHAYISAGSSYTLQMPDGRYQVFFYYGKQWNKNKRMSSDECSYLYGGFDLNEYVTKDDPVTLNNQVLTYTLYSVSNGNFQTKSSSLEEAL